MPQCKALKSFHSDKYGMIRTGTRFSSEQGYALELATKGLVEIINAPLEPERKQAFTAAPLSKGPQPFPGLADPPGAGEAKPFVSLPAAQASQKPTAQPSKPSGNAKR